jgi:hypothetical protein
LTGDDRVDAAAEHESGESGQETGDNEYPEHGALNADACRA